jgi:hypothetical protein
MQKDKKIVLVDHGRGMRREKAALVGTRVATLMGRHTIIGEIGTESRWFCSLRD